MKALNRVAKAIVAGTVSGALTYTTAHGQGTIHAVVAAAVIAVATGILTWATPNSVEEKVAQEVLADAKAVAGAETAGVK